VDISNGRTARATPEVAGAFDVLLVGADNAANQTGFGAARQTTLNDVNILIHVAADHRSGVVISFPRDLVIDHPACVDPATHATYPAVTGEPLNAAIARGGLGCVVATVQHLTGLTIPYAALLSFNGTVALANAVGGVPVCVNRAIHDRDSGLSLPAGRSVISGRTALAYLRDRHGVGDGSDLARISSQQAYMSSLMRKMTSSSTLTDPARLYGLASAAAHNATLSTSLADPATMVGMMLAVGHVSLGRMVFVQFPTEADPANPNKVVPDPAVASALLKRVHLDQPVRLAPGARGYSTTTATSPKAKHASSASAQRRKGGSAKTSAAGALTGVHGQTAAQQTCSVAAS
jgi:LCP family protein required for cell wall assembly